MGRRPVGGLCAAVLVLSFAACSTPAPAPKAAGQADTAFTAGATLPPTVSAQEVVPPAQAAPAPSGEPSAVLSAGGIVVPVLGREGDGWKVSTPCGRDAMVTSTSALPASPIVLDPGHGGYDPGAVGPNGLYESDLNLAVSRHAAAALERAGYPTVMTRNVDHGMNLVNRAQIALRTKARAFVSVHHNAASWNPSAIPGSEMYHQVASADSKRLAGLIYEEIVAALSAYDVPWVTSGAGVTWRTRASNGDDWYAMVRQPKGIAAALAELAFISNPAEADLLADPDVQRVEGEAVARGIIRFLTTADAGSGYIDGGNMPSRNRPGGPPVPRPTGDDWSACDDPAL